MINAATLAGAMLFLNVGNSSAGEPVPPPPAPAAEPSGCVNPGFSLDGSVLYLNSQGESLEGDWDIGFRGQGRYQSDDGFIAAVSGFFYDGDIDEFMGDSDYSGDLEMWYLDFTLGDNLHNGDKFCLDVTAGLRYGSLEAEIDDYEEYDTEFDGWGPVITLEGIRKLGGPWAIYFNLRQSILFGEVDYDDEDYSGDTVGFVSEVGGGLQYGLDNLRIRVGGEGQFWSVDEHDTGLYGFSAGASWSF